MGQVPIPEAGDLESAAVKVMERGDIAGWTTTRMIVILEGVLCTPMYEKKGRMRKHETLLPASKWQWEMVALKQVIDYITRANVAVEVVTFISEDVADEAADFFSQYDVPVSSTEFADFDWFCRSLVWRPEVTAVIDTEMDRLMRYGQRGTAVQRGESF